MTSATSVLPKCCIISSTSLFTSKNSVDPFLYLPPKPYQFSLSSSCSSWVSQKQKHSHFHLVPVLVAQTSDWAQQEEGEAEVEEEEIESVEGGGGEEEDESYPEPPEGAKLFVGNLPYDFDSEKLAQLFDSAGVVEIAEVIYNRDTEQSRGFGFVSMSTVEEAEKAVEMFNRYDLNGRLLTVNKAAPRGTQPERVPRASEPSFKIYVGNLPWQVDNSRLEQVFSEHGKVVDARVIYDRETGRSRGFGFVTMASETELNDAIAALDGQSLDGRAIRVNAAEERPKRGFY